MAAALVVCFGLGCPAPPPEEDPNAVPIGAVLPFTGDIAASGTNIERALLLAFERVNDAGGIAGRPLRLVAADSHSEMKRGLDAARHLLEDEGVFALLGPENEDLAPRIVPLIREREVVSVSGGVTSPGLTTIDDGGYWFRTCPSALSYAEALARRMYDDGVRRAAVLYVADGDGTGFSNVLTNQFVSLGITAPPPTSFQPGQQSYTSVLRDLLAEDLDALVLVSYAKSGATIVGEWAVLGGQARWYLAPALKTDMFVANVPPGLLEGAVGVGPDMAGDAPRFAAAFAERWGGDQPLESAYFYYDAAALLSLAMARAAADAGGEPTGQQVRDALATLSQPDGTHVAWNQLGEALRLAEAGMPIRYRGASGDLQLDDHGDLVSPRIGFWTIQEDRIVDAFSNEASSN